MYFQSQATIKRMYTSSVIESLESDFSDNTFLVIPETKPPADNNLQTPSDLSTSPDLVIVPPTEATNFIYTPNTTEYWLSCRRL